MLKISPLRKKKSLEDDLKRFKDQPTINKILQSLLSSKKQNHPSTCPHCQSHWVIGHGQYRGRQRYKCKSCERTFNEYTNPPLHRTHFPDKWVKFLESMVRGESLRLASISIGISYVTLFYWRHKLIHAMLKLTSNKVPYSNQKYIPVGFYPPTWLVSQEQSYRFGSWILRFNWIAGKYLTRYVAWFHFIDRHRKEPLQETMTEFLVQSSSISLEQTYQNLRNAS